MVRRFLARIIRFRLFRVSGHSMWPTFHPGDWLCVRLCPHGAPGALPQPGQIVLLRDPASTQRLLVKRVRSLGDATFAVGSDDPTQGRDSRHFGSLSAEHLVGHVVFSWPRRNA